MPLWLAMILKKEGKCRIIMPEWMRLNHLKEVLEKDRSLDLSNDQSLASLPDHYIEISRLLLENCEDDIADAHEVRSVIDAIVKVRENRLNEFRGTVVDYLSQSLVRKFNQGDTQEFVRRSFYDVIGGVSALEAQRLSSHFIPVLEQLNKTEDIRKQLLYQQ